MKKLIPQIITSIVIVTLVIGTSCNKLKPDFAVDFFSKTPYIKLKDTKALGYGQLGTAQPLAINIDSIISANGGGGLKLKKFTLKEAHLDVVSDTITSLDAMQSFAGMVVNNTDTSKIVYKTPMPQNGANYVRLDISNDDLVAKVNKTSTIFAAYGNMNNDLVRDVTLSVRVRYSATLGY
jgi:hypothetical protein